MTIPASPALTNRAQERSKGDFIFTACIVATFIAALIKLLPYASSDAVVAMVCIQLLFCILMVFWPQRSVNNGAAEEAASGSVADEQRDPSGGQWLPCTPSLILAGVNCGETPRRQQEGACNHEHFISFAEPTAKQRTLGLAETASQ